jgi:hypothetical protein
MSKDHQIKLSVNTATRGKFSPEMWGGYSTADEATRNKQAWAWYNRQFRAETMTVRDMLVRIWNGYAFTAVFNNNRRIKANFAEAWHIAFDFDTADDRSSLETLTAKFVYQQHGAFCYSTPSSTPSKPKSRMVFCFNEPMTDLERYETLYRAILLLWGFGKPVESGKKGETRGADEVTKDGLRLFFGSYKCETHTNWQLLDTPIIDGLIEAYNDAEAERTAAIPVIQRHTLVPERGGRVMAKICTALENDLAEAVDGEKHRTLAKIAYVLGGYVAGGYLSATEAMGVARAGIARMRNVNDKEAAERTAWGQIEAGQAKPILLTSGAGYVLDKV